jgi:hypothetical protein
MEKRGLNRELFLGYFQCKRKVFELANNSEARRLNQNYAEHYNAVTFKEKASEIIIAEEKATAKKIMKNKTFRSSDGEEVIIDLLVEYPNENTMIEFVPKTIKHIGSEKWWIAYKAFVLRKCNYRVDKVLLVCRDWEFETNKYDRKFLYIEEVQNSVQRFINAVPQKIEYINNAMKDVNLLNKEVGLYCTEPSDCPLKSICWKNINSEQTVFDLREFTSKKQFNLFWQDYYLLKDFPIAKAIKNDKKRLKSILDNKEIINHDKLEEHFSNIIAEGKAYFLSMEYFKHIIQSVNIWSYKSIPYQFTSIFINYKSKTLSQKQKLLRPDEDATAFFSELIYSLNIHESAPIIVFNAYIVRNCLANLVKSYPQYEASVKALLERIVDLRYCFEHLYYYHPRFKGSLRVKDIASVLISSVLSSFEMQVLQNTNSKEEYHKWILKVEDYQESKKLIKDYSVAKAKSIQFITQVLLNLISPKKTSTN